MQLADAMRLLSWPNLLSKTRGVYRTLYPALPDLISSSGYDPSGEWSERDQHSLTELVS